MSLTLGQVPVGQERWGSRARRVWCRTLSPALAPYISSITVLERDAGERDQIFVLPDGQATLLFKVMMDGHRLDSASVRRGEAVIDLIGPRTRAGVKAIENVPLSVVVTLTEIGAYTLTGIATDSIADRFVQLREIWGSGAARLTAALTRAATHKERLDLLERCLLLRLDACSAATIRAAGLIGQAIDAQGHGNRRRCFATATVRVGSLSHRQTRRLFKKVVGVNARTLQRIERFNRAVRLATSTPLPQWADIAALCGYYDQAHMAAEFNDFVGLPPSRFLLELRSGFPPLARA